MRAFLGTGLAGLLLAVAGCTPEVGIPAGAQIACAGDGGCPTGYACNELGRCVPANELDAAPPGLSASAVAPAAVAAGGELTVTLEATEPLAGLPSVRLNLRPSPEHLACEGGPSVFTCSHLARGDENEGQGGLVELVADLVDPSGNGATVLLGTVELDFAAPSAAIASVEPDRVPLGGRVQLFLTASEELAGVPVVVADPPLLEGAALPMAREGETRNYRLTHDVVAGDPRSAVRFTVVLADPLGNESAPILLGETTLDPEPPVIEGLALEPSPAAVGDELRVRFSVSDPEVTVLVRLGDAELTCAAEAAAWTCSGIATPAAGEEGRELSRGVLVTATDLAGNVGVAGSSVLLDFKPPELVETGITLTAGIGSPRVEILRLGAGSSLRASLVFDEPLREPPSVIAFAGDRQRPLALEGGSGSSFVFGLALPDGEPEEEADYRLLIQGQDRVGNPITAEACGCFALDTSRPSAPDTATGGLVLLERRPYGRDGDRPSFDVTLAPGAVEPGALVLAHGGPSALDVRIGRGTADARGAGEVPLEAADRAAVWVAAVDEAGNVSPVAEVRDVAWTATLGGKVAGSLLENPTTLVTTPALGARVEQDPVQTAEADGSALAGIAARDGAVDCGGESSGPCVRSAAFFRGRTPTLVRPGTRSLAGLVHDSARDRLVLFGGYGAELENSLWELDLGTGRWLDRTPAGRSPSPRTGMAMTYDRRRDVTVVFGGEDDFGFPGETWEWDGHTGAWFERTPATSPGPRRGTAGAYDPRRGVTVLFGGQDDLGGRFGDTWEYDGRSWVDRTPAVSPPASSDHALAWDPVRGVVTLLLGGEGLWSWDGAAWTAIPGSAPAGETPTSLAFDERAGQLVAAGGLFFAGPSIAWDGTSWSPIWSELSPDPLGGRMGTAMSGAGPGRGAFAFGGMTESRWTRTLWNDLWETHPDRGWRDRTVVASPPLRASSSFAWDSGRGRAIRFGGTYQDPEAGSVYTDELQELDVETAVWSLPAASGPAARSFAALAYHGGLGQTLLFGGLAPGGLRSDLWSWDGASWTPYLAMLPWPSARREARLCHDAGRDVTVLFGGFDGSGYPQDVWEWSEAGGWMDRTPAVSPPGRTGHQLVYDERRGMVVLLAGHAGATFHADVWEWDGTLWTERTPPGMPVGLWGEFAFEPGRGRIVALDHSPEQLWEWDGTTGAFSARPFAGPTPLTGQLPSVVFDPRSGSLVGVSGSEIEPDGLWDVETGGTALPAVIWTVPWSAANAGELLPSGLTVTLDAAGSGTTGGGALAGGARLLVWEPDAAAWLEVATHGAAAGTLAQLAWSENDPGALARYLVGSRRELILAVVPAEPMRTGEAPAEVAVDYLELQLRYRR